MKRKIFLSLSMAAILSTCAAADNISEYQKIDTTKPGKYLITYSVTDSFGQETTIQRTVIVDQNEKPVISISGGQNIRVKNGDQFVDPGVTANDAEDGDLTSSVSVSGSVDTTKDGVYTINYSVTDSFNQTVTATRTVTVYSSDDIDKTVIEDGTATNVSLWDYLVAKSNDTILLQKYANGYKTKSELISRDLSGGVLTKSFDYTERKVSYKKDGDGNIVIDFVKDSSVTDSVVVKPNVGFNETITVEEPGDADQRCYIKAQYNKIKLGGQEYNDVIEMVCGNNTEAYFEKEKGLILENEIDTSVQEESVKKDVFSGSGESVDTLVADDVYPLPMFHTLNYSSAGKIDITRLWTEYGLNGSGVKVGVVDVGSVRSSHVEFDDRVTSLSDADYSNHSTHVAGTIGAAGVRDEAHGMANAAEIYSTTFNTSGVFVASAKKLLDDNGVYITNHSYGFTSKVRVGEYDSYAGEADKTIYENPKIIMVKSAGNDRGKSDYDDYKIIKSVGNAKSVFTIGAIEEDNSLAYFSSTGPAPLGRVKPDFVTKGYGILSTSSDGDDTYESMSGTSMAAPAFSGLMALLEEYYSGIMDEYMRVDTAKSIIANTAKDIGRAGPDYQYGFGLPDGYEAVKVIETMSGENTLVQDRTILKEFKHSYTFTVSDETDFSATLSWIDQQEDTETSSLITDLDMVVKNNDTGELFYPFTLNGTDGHYEDPAVSDKENHVDVVEQIRKTLSSGSYTLFVKPYKMGSQTAEAYTLTTNIPLRNYSEENMFEAIDEIESKILSSIQ